MLEERERCFCRKASAACVCALTTSSPAGNDFFISGTPQVSSFGAAPFVQRDLLVGHPRLGEDKVLCRMQAAVVDPAAIKVEWMITQLGADLVDIFFYCGL